MIYPDSFKAKMVQRLSAPNAISAIKLAKEVGVSQSALSRWLEVARTVEPMTKERPSDRAVQTGSTRSAAEKMSITPERAADEVVRPRPRRIRRLCLRPQRADQEDARPVADREKARRAGSAPPTLVLPCVDA